MSIHVAMATYNGEKYVREQIESICAQTLRPDKIIIVDDGSSDKTIEIIKALQVTSPVEIELHVNKNNMGVIKTFDKALSLCDSDYIALADQDDVWLPSKLEKLSNKIKDLESDHVNAPLLVYSDLEVVDGDLNLQYESLIKVTGFDKFDDKSPLKTLVERNHIPGCATMFNRELRNVAVPIPADCRMHDYWINLLAATTGRMELVPEALMYFRRHGSNVTEVVGGESSSDIFLRKLSYIPRFIPELFKLLSGAYKKQYFDEQLELLTLVSERSENIVLKQYVDKMSRGGLSSCLYFTKESLQLHYTHEFYLSLMSHWFAQFWKRFK